MTAPTVPTQPVGNTPPPTTPTPPPGAPVGGRSRTTPHAQSGAARELLRKLPTGHTVLAATLVVVGTGIALWRASHLAFWLFLVALVLIALVVLIVRWRRRRTAAKAAARAGRPAGPGRPRLFDPRRPGEPRRGLRGLFTGARRPDGRTPGGLRGLLGRLPGVGRRFGGAPGAPTGSRPGGLLSRLRNRMPGSRTPGSGLNSRPGTGGGGLGGRLRGLFTGARNHPGPGPGRGPGSGRGPGFGWPWSRSRTGPPNGRRPDRHASTGQGGWWSRLADWRKRRNSTTNTPPADQAKTPTKPDKTKPDENPTSEPNDKGGPMGLIRKHRPKPAPDPRVGVGNGGGGSTGGTNPVFRDRAALGDVAAGYRINSLEDFGTGLRNFGSPARDLAASYQAFLARAGNDPVPVSAAVIDPILADLDAIRSIADRLDTAYQRYRDHHTADRDRTIHSPRAGERLADSDRMRESG